ncbi:MULTISPECIES: winged helix-turn-helix domain-containing protein [unclassified Rathayibacter]|uniref:winged helix-turn-helix domain-containing protein n=1 Tax=unclassified Rathayibacter TaxID=2609250 RepID=UPI0015E31BA5|nr:MULTISPECIES: winged helix-turn-helix domain-containing protein [unclassified Rathayibacter]
MLTVDDFHHRALNSPDDFIEHGIELRPHSDALSALLAIGAHDIAAVVAPTALAGTDLTLFVRAVASWTRAPVVVAIDGSPESAAAAYEAMNAGARALIAAPFTPAALTNTLSLLGFESAPSAAVLQQGPLRLDTQAHQVSVDGVDVRLPLQQFLLLRYLLTQAPRAVTFTELTDAASGFDGTNETAVRTQISRMRRRLDAAVPGSGRLIDTVAGVGYRLTA